MDTRRGHVIWASPFSNRSLDLLDRAKAIEVRPPSKSASRMLIPSTSRPSAQKRRNEDRRDHLRAFGASRNLAPRWTRIKPRVWTIFKRCIDFAEALGSPYMYPADVLRGGGDAAPQSEASATAVESRRRVLARRRGYAGDRAIELAIEPDCFGPT